MTPNNKTKPTTAGKAESPTQQDLNPANFEKLRELQDLTAGELLPELKPYVEYISPDLPQVLHHPLVIQPYILPRLANQTYRRKLQLLNEATDIETVIFLHERPFRINRFLTWLEEDAPNTNRTAETLAKVWIDTESVPPSIQRKLLKVFKSVGFTTDRGQQKPDGPLTVYRGGHRGGISWTTSIDTATWFANRWTIGSTPPQPLYQATAPPTAVLALLDDKKEHEVIVDPAKLRNVRRIAPPEPRSTPREQVQDLLKTSPIQKTTDAGPQLQTQN